VIQANDPRLKTAEGWVALGAPKDATRWVGPHERPWEIHANGQRFVFDQNANGWFLISIENKVPIHPEHTIISRPASEETKALLKLSRKFGLGTSLTINIAPGVCSIHDNHGDEFRFPIERAHEVIEAWGIVEAARSK
jgi:hypothetical protein